MTIMKDKNKSSLDSDNLINRIETTSDETNIKARLQNEQTFREIVDLIKNRVNLVDLIEQHVDLKKVGSRHVGICPFHEEKTPSFFVEEDQYHCFGCGDHGDVFDFLLKHLNMPFNESLEKLSKDSGISTINSLSEQERKDLHTSIKKKRETEKQKLAEKRKFAVQKANRIWDSADIEPTNPEHRRYINKKGISPIGIRFGKNQQGYESAIIPLKNLQGELQSLQFISIDENGITYKSFLTNGEKKGNCFATGDIADGKPFFVAEGYATAVSIHECTSIPVIAAMDSGNLLSVIGSLSQKYPNSEITIAADRQNEKNNIGQEKAEEAAKHYGCKVVIPLFPKGKELNSKGELHTDFNDLHQTCGIEEVRNQLINGKKIIITFQNEIQDLPSDLLKKNEPCEGFSTSALPKYLHEYISSIAETTKAHPIMITSSVLATISSFVKRKAFISENDFFQTLYPNLWMLNITKSGGFKTTSLNKGAKLAWRRAEEVHNKLKQIEKKIKLSKADDKNNLEDERLIASIENPILPGKITSEALMEHLGLGHGGVIITSEFGAWLQNMEKSHNSDLKQIFTDLYDVPPFFHYKTKTSGDHLIKKPFLSICGVSTLPWIKDNLKPGDVSSGFFARFLLFTPPNTEDIPPALPKKSIDHNTTAEQKINDTLRYMDNEYVFKFTIESGKYFEELHRSIYEIPKQYSESCQEILDPYLKRWSPYILKLAMLIRLFEAPHSSELSDTSLHAAMEIVKVAIKSTAKLFEGELGESEQQRKFRLVFEKIYKRTTSGKPCTYGYLLTSKVLPGGSKEYDNTLEYLINAGKIYTIDKHPKKETLYFPEKTEKVEKS